jgi:hypothetical protein
MPPPVAPQLLLVNELLSLITNFPYSLLIKYNPPADSLLLQSLIITLLSSICPFYTKEDIAPPIVALQLSKVTSINSNLLSYRLIGLYNPPPSYA